LGFGAEGCLKRSDQIGGWSCGMIISEDALAFGASNIDAEDNVGITYESIDAITPLVV